MRFELPVLRRCCFCVPLRRGVIAWAYANLAFQALLMYINVHIMIILAIFVQMVGIGDIILEIFSTLVILSSVVYSILIIVACHKKSAKLLRVSYKYGIFDSIFTIIYSMCALYREIQFIYIRRQMFGDGQSPIRSIILDMAMLFASNFFQILLQGYMILLLRSEMIKLQEQSLEIEFVNNAADSEARCVRTQRSDDSEAQCSADCTDYNSEEQCFSAQRSADDNGKAQHDSEAQCDKEAKRDGV